MKTVIAKEFHWEMGHRLPYHDGACRNLHGHSYKMLVTFEGEPDAHGMVMDYYDVSTLIRPMIEEMDHAFMCDESDTVVLPLLQSNDFKTVLVPFYTTAENIAAYLLGKICDLLGDQTRIRRVTVRVYETERTYAEVKRKLYDSHH